jgi:hypothetical protein
MSRGQARNAVGRVPVVGERLSDWNFPAQTGSVHRRLHDSAISP